jgi:Secretion system C-terminal sorting domain
MKNITKHYFFLILLLAAFCQVSLAQFKVVPLQNSIKEKPSSAKITALSLPFFDDFSTSFNTQDLSKWQKGGGVYINNTFTTNHPTVNVATFDGLKADGNPYDFNNQLAQGATDSLTSMPIDLSRNPARKDSAYILKDSLYLSFFYKREGLGEKPDLNDSLKVEFLTDGGKWQKVTLILGDTAKIATDKFVQIFIPINKNIFFHSGFQFRFLTFGKQSGQFDVWHIDYVYLDKNRSIKKPFYVDFACRNPMSSILSRYNSMPMKQFLENPTRELSGTLKSDVYNLSGGANFVRVFYSVKNLLTNESFIDSIPQITVESQSSTIIETKNNIAQQLKGSKANVEIQFNIKSGDAPIFTVNDKIKTNIILDNYYAYDDGTAEQAAYLKKGFGRVAVQYNLNKPDAITAVRIHIPPTVTNLAGKRLTLQIMSDKDGKPDRILKTVSDSTTTIKYANTPNAFIEYKIKDSVNVEGTFYIGYVQFSDDEPLVVGLDLNSPQFSERHFYNISNEWIQVPKANVVNTNSTFSPIKGSLMIRPVMAGKTARVITLANEEEIQDKNLVISPNPSTGIFRWNDVTLKNAEVFDMTGRAIFQEKTNNQEVNLQNLNSGVYFLRLSNEKNTFVRKIVKE